MKYFIYLIFIAFPYTVNAQSVDHWETVIQHEDPWNYLVPSNEPNPAWHDLEFDDSSWETGNSGFGYGDGDDNTEVSTTLSLYLRSQFNIVDKSAIEEMVLSMDYDDAFVAYLNGIEIARANISGEPPLFNQQSDGLHEALLYQGIPPENFRIDHNTITALLNEGNNVIAIQVHNRDLSSSDLSAIPVLSVGINNSSADYHEPPSWFHPPLEFSSSDLPIVVVNTNGQTIVDDPKVQAVFGIIDNGPGNTNHLSDPKNEFLGICGIEIRGESSQSFPKKSYGIEMWDANGNDIDTSFLNFPAEEDFILHGPYSDKSLFNNVLAMHLGNELGHYSSRTRFVELVIDNDYKGVYVIMEKIKRDKDRVDIADLNPEDISGDQLTGGYIFRIDKGVYDGWPSKYNAYGSNNGIFYQYYYPSQLNILPPQKEYIQNYMDDFEDAIASSTLRNSKGKHYLDYIDLRSFVDTFILNELSKNVDAYRLSTYFHKNRDSKGGKISAGPLWDFNLAFGNGDYCGGDDIAGWEYYQCPGSSPFWWDTMLKESEFSTALRCRWEELRQSTLHTDNINAYLDSMTNHLSGSLDRNFQRWPVMGIYLWPNSWFYAASANHDEVMSYMKDWIRNRSEWLDANIPGEAMECERFEPPYQGIVTGIESASNTSFKVFPNPATSILYIEGIRAVSEIKIVNMLGKSVLNQNPNADKVSIDISVIPRGIYILSIKYENGLEIKKIQIR